MTPASLTVGPAHVFVMVVPSLPEADSTLQTANLLPSRRTTKTRRVASAAVHLTTRKEFARRNPQIEANGRSTT